MLEGNEMRTAGILMANAIALTPLAARAVGEGVEFGARVGYAIPDGAVGGDGSGNGVPFRTWLEHAIPIELDLGYRFDPHVYAGIYGGYSVISRTYCETGECSNYGARVGANVQLHPLGQVPIAPWFGLGVGYEWLSFSQRFSNGNDDRMLEGFEFAILQAGIDFTVSSTSPVIKLGPVLTFSLATFRKETFRGAGSVDIDERLHEWLVLGFRVRFLP